MAPFQCDRENQVIEAVRSGRHPSQWDEPLRAHVAGCAVCRDAAMVAEFLRLESNLAGAEARLPDPGLVWWKAQLLARREAAERAVRPIAVAEKLAHDLEAVHGFLLSLSRETIHQISVNHNARFRKITADPGSLPDRHAFVH